jgi:catechol 2,3-dioxygenase
VVPLEAASRPIDPGVRIGHVHLRSSDIDRVKDFTSACSASTLSPRRVACRAGARPATSCSSRPAAITTTSASARGSRPAAARCRTGSRACTTSRSTTDAALVDAGRRLRAAGWPLRQLTDRGTHLAIYLSDPDENELELAWDRPLDEWPRGAQWRAAMATDDAFDLDALLAAQ